MFLWELITTGISTTKSGGALELAADGNIVGTNDYILIPCTGQKREGDRIKESLKPVIETGF